jgi:carbonic anhydrase/acetyltransferase-like protein (isoleucine patch superfamily)
MLMSLGERRPRLHAAAWVASDATVVGDVTMAEQASLWFAAVIRADGDSITVGARSNIQDGCVLHCDPGFPLLIGAGVTVGHRAVLHGCRISDDVLIGMGAIVMNGATIGTGSIIGAGAVVSEGTDVPPRSLVLGVPGKVRREVSSDEFDSICRNARTYVERLHTYRDASR